MSEYQYYEFQAVDRPLTAEDRAALRSISSRAQITATSFTNSYEWGDLKGDPLKMVAQWFDLHLYVANWNSRRLVIRVPARLVDRAALGRFIDEVDWVELHDAGSDLIVDMSSDDGPDPDTDYEWDDGTAWLAALAPLRADFLAGDLRLFYLLWLTAVQADAFPPDTPEPLPGIGPLTGALQAFADFFYVDPNLAAAAAERHSAAAAAADPRPFIAAMPEAEKTALLVRLAEGDLQAGHELRGLVARHAALDHAAPPARTVGELRARAAEIEQERARAAAAKAATERTRKEEQAAKDRRARLDALSRRGESVWREVETEIERRNASGYDAAARLLADLQGLARENGTTRAFDTRLGAIRAHHASKRTFMERLAGLR